nr:DEAD/DEAH box helicase family protein [Treponemataceae bacterium]
MENLFEFQTRAIDELHEKFGNLWNTKADSPVQLLLKAPTGSGKTIISTTFIDSLQVPNEKIENLGKVAFIWITKGDNLVMQSKNKFADYFYPNLRNTLSTFDSCSDTLKENEVLFINWEKITQSKGKDRLNRRRPEDPDKYKETGFYFEDLMENTHAAGIEIILVVDESHANFDTPNASEIIKLISPHLIFKMSATPFKTEKDENEFYAAKGRGFADFVEIAQSDVVQAGLIKEEIESQTNEDLERTKGTNANIDEVMLDLAIEKREQIKREWQHLGQNINPLVLIQLPNDDSKLDEKVETKEEFTLKYLKKRGIKENNIAVWLEDKKKKAEWRLEDEDSEIDFLIFKLACGTGWDCPRANVLVMFREIKSPVFQTQTLGRIIRMPRPDRELLKNSPLLRKGYLYTTYARNQVGTTLISGTANKPKIFTSNLDSNVRKSLVTKSLVNDLFDFVTTVELAQKSSEEKCDNTKINYTELLSKPIETGKNPVSVTLKKVALDENKKNELFAKINSIVNKKVEYLFDPNAGNLILSEPSPTYKPSAKKISEVVSVLKQQAIDIKKEITNTTASLEKSSQKEDEIQMQIETLAGKREAEIVLDECLKNDFIARASYNDFGSV